MKRKERKTKNNGNHNMMKIWEAYVKAQEIIVNQYSQSFKTQYIGSQNDDTYIFEHIDDDREGNLIGELKNKFPEISDDKIFLEKGYFLYKSDLLETLDKEKLEEFKKYCDANYYDFVTKPCLTGSVKLNKNLPNYLSERLNINIDDKGSSFVTIDELCTIDDLLKQIEGLNRKKKIKAELHINASRYCMNREFKKVKEYITNKLSFRALKPLGYYNKIIINYRIPKNVQKWINDNTLYRITKEKIVTKNTRLRDRYLLEIDDKKFLNHIEKKIPNNLFKLNKQGSIITFFLNNKNDLYEKLLELENVVDLGFKEPNKGTKYEVSFNRFSLEKVISKLQEIPSISIDKLKNEFEFRSYVESIEELQVLKSIIHDKLYTFDSSLFNYQISNVPDGYVRFNLYFRSREYIEETQLKFKYLRGEELLLDGKEFGVLDDVKYPKFYINSEIVPSFEYNKTYSFGSTLKGTKDKIKRLSDTVNAIFGEGRIVNNRLKEVLIDASKANTGKRKIVETSIYEEKLKFVEDEMLASAGRLNEKQKEAVTKSLLGDDLFIIQGPPGTGKSTAIAEIIWQHIRNEHRNKEINIENDYDYNEDDEHNYKILVTSETNLAVDNALDKLRAKHHTLIKPIRFGLEEKLDKEGKRFSLGNLQNWAEMDIEEFDEENNLKVNILRDWINQIESRVGHSENKEVNEVLLGWKKILSNSNRKTRQLFFNAYKHNVNVVGATCSSIGKLNSIEKQTRFFREYNQVYFPTRSSKNTRNSEITFDLVIQDEASKASPPELALPCIYGKKAIIIGDHRQLPPMVNASEFKEDLEFLANRSSDDKYRNEIKSLIDTIENNEKAFEKSHFERLFYAIPNNLKSSFNEQYRMHPAINETIKQFYKNDDGLNCGLDNELVDLPNLSEPQSRFHGIDIENILSTDTHVLWLNVETPEYKKRTSRVNFGEIEAIEFLIKKISKSTGYKNFISFWKGDELDEKEIGIITFYGSQASELNKLKEKYPKVPFRISPVDRFQGMERNIVIVSTVRSNRITEFPNQKPDFEKYGKMGYTNQSSLGFAQFPNRLNVALSRAKRLLIVVGNAEHFSRMKIYKNVLETIKSHPNGQFLNFTDIKNK